LRIEEIIRNHKVVLRAWTYGEKQDAIRKATTWKRTPDGSLTPDVDPWTLNDLMLLATLVEWDLRSEDGIPLPITLESLRGIEPPELVEEMIAATQRLNDLSDEGRKKS